MTFKIIALLACVAVARAGLIPAVAHPVLEKSDENDPNPQYTFGYDIQDALSGDSKNQYETRDGDLVRGQYSLNDPDGFRRIVDYTADSVNGFNAVVRKEPIGVAVKTVAAAPTATLIKSAPAQLAYTAAAPTLIKTAAYSAPIVHAPTVIQSTGNAIVKTTYTSPIASYAY